MFGIGTGELLLLALIALLVLGPERMPRLMRDVGKTVNDLRKTSDELRSEFLNSDLTAERVLDVASRAPAPVEAPAPVVSEPPPPATQAEVVTEPAEPQVPDETAFDREARLARERLEDPANAKARDEQAAAEGWKIPTDEAGTSPREG